METGVPLAAAPGGIAADRAAEPSAAISRLRLRLRRSFAILKPEYACLCLLSIVKSG